jgi:hypothetical protein
MPLLPYILLVSLTISFLKLVLFISIFKHTLNPLARMGERRGAYRALVGKPEGRRPLGRSRSRWEDNIKMDLPRGWVWGRRQD